MPGNYSWAEKGSCENQVSTVGVEKDSFKVKLTYLRSGKILVHASEFFRIIQKHSVMENQS